MFESKKIIQRNFSFSAFPVFTKQPTNVTVRTTERVRLDCAVDGDPKPQIYWQFNFGNDFPAARERRMQLVDNYESIIIDNAKASDRGVYTCTAENAAGIIRTNVTVEISKWRKILVFYKFYMKTT